MTSSRSELGRRAAALLTARVGTLRTAGAAAAAWTGAGTRGAWPVLLVCGLLLAGGALALLRWRRVSATGASGVIAALAGIALLAGLAGLLAGAHAARAAEAPRQASATASLIGESQETPSGRWRAVAEGEFGRATLLAEEPLPPAGTVVRARLDWFAEDAAGVRELRIAEAPGPLWEARTEVRAGLTRASAGGHAGADLLPGLVIGDTSRVGDRLEQDMRTVSLSHLTAVSGANILIVAGTVLVLASHLTASWPLRLLPAAGVTAAYVFVVGPEPSVTRAAAMAVLVGIGLLRPAGTPTTAVLASAVALLLIGMPHLAGEIGFALSVAATAGLVLLAPPLTRLLTDRRVPRLLAAALALPAAAQLMCTPLLIVLAPQLSPWAVPANLAAGPAVAPATVAGLAAMALEACGLSGPAALCGSLGALCAWWIAAVGRICAGLPGAALAWPEGPGGIVLACLLAACAGLTLLARGGPRLLSAAAACGIAAGGLLGPGAGTPGRGDWSALVCDVGQGSAALIRSAETSAEHALLVDTGDDPAALEACLRGSGITRLTLALSHFDRDHVGALDAAVAAAEITALAYPAALGASPEAAAARRTVLAGSTRTPALVPAEAGACLPAGALPPGVRACALWPPPAPAAHADGNGHSLVLRTEADGLTVLLPGDIGLTQSVLLAPVLAAAPPVDLLLAPHHGSGDMSPALHAAARPRLGAVSVGADNGYGHPTREALAAFGPAPVLRTDLCGSIALIRDGGARTEHAGCGR
ncbi:ComEC/Rec2 family competence protein [Brevibacterium album]|uniref:ComEC/Rec2 family competence protein n=1 Tax=Brevibacterium album TaxID=417948 RepID=UPI00041C5905|nr:ComEC/Rec2 family competence protein [Brevibacterium album]